MDYRIRSVTRTVYVASTNVHCQFHTNGSEEENKWFGSLQRFLQPEENLVVVLYTFLRQPQVQSQEETDRRHPLTHPHQPIAGSPYCMKSPRFTSVCSVGMQPVHISEWTHISCTVKSNKYTVTGARLLGFMYPPLCKCQTQLGKK